MEIQLNYENAKELFNYFSEKKRKHENELARLKAGSPQAVNLQKSLVAKIEFSTKWINLLK